MQKPFRDATLFLANVDGSPFAPMKPIVEGMGLSWQPQHEKLKSNQRLATCITEIVMQLPGDDQRRKVTCLPLRKLPAWLMTISPNKVAPEVKDLVIAYQNECDDALWDYWTKGQAVNPRGLPDFSDSIAAARAWADAKERELFALAQTHALTQQIEADRPYTELAKAITGQETMGRRDWVAMMKNDHGLGAKEKQVTKFLMDKKYIYPDQSDGRSRAYAEHADLFKLEMEPHNGKLRPVLKITGKGVMDLTPIVLRHFSGNEED